MDFGSPWPEIGLEFFRLRAVNNVIPVMTIRIVLADPHPVVHEGLICCRPQPWDVVAHVTTFQDLESLLDEAFADVLVTEVRLQGRDVLKLVETAMQGQPELKVVVFTGCDNPMYVARASSIGCCDFVRKTEPVKNLVGAVKRAASSAGPPSDSLLVETRNRMRRPRQAIDHDVPLTNRELQVLRHVAMGLSNREVGKSLGISVETVKEHVQNILRKLGVNDRTQAAVWAVKRGLC